MLIDLRSDTVTKPTKAMLEAMFNAEVGDDVFNEDSSVNVLEQKAAGLFGKEAALFCASGTMTNQIAIKVHTQPGDELICDEHSHIYHYEGGGISRNAGVQARLIRGNRGRINASQIEEQINGDYDWLARTKLVALENTINKAGGSYYKLNDIQPIYELCKSKNLKLHLDGARLFNALTETGESTMDTGRLFDSISICLSKGLGAPVGSLLIGTKDFIKEARRVRKSMGGGMRQAGYLAAAGIYALDHHITRLKEDHKRAKTIETILKDLDWVQEVLPVETNIVVFKLKENKPAEQLIEALLERKIKAALFGRQTIRFVTHLDFTDEMLELLRAELKAI